MFGQFLVIFEQKSKQKTSRILSAILGRLLGGPGAPQLPKTMIFIKRVANFRRSPFSPRDRFLVDFGAILATFWGHFGDVFLCCFARCVSRRLFGAQKGDGTSRRSDFGWPGEGKGEG